ncbi:homeobox KN domain-containing protein [Xylaria scruposa]|nr:homeobox KN domain-containing protein [Xylaria scruposa]
MTVDRMTPPDQRECPKRIWEVAELQHLARPCSERPKISLPSIHQAFPDLEQLVGVPEPLPELQRDRLPRTPPSATSPTGGAQYHGPITPPDYVISPNRSKRRRVSFQEEVEVYEVPRPYTVARRMPQSPSLETRLPFRPWVDSAPPSPYYADYKTAIPTRSPDCVNPHERTETHRAPPCHPISNYEPGVGGNYRVQGHSSDEYHRTQGHNGDEYVMDSSRRSSYAPINNDYSTEVGGHGYRPSSYQPYGYHHPSRAQSLSMGSAQLERLERTPFSPGGYYHHQETYMRVGGDFGMGTNGEGKQRKRRGNLPKETTEILRNWFLAHLAHPYPTEDEKQALMRETNLQMNQISNWFINARRRQLPSMINNARAEADAIRGGRSGDGNEPERHRTQRGSV